MKPAERFIWAGVLLAMGTLSALARAESRIEMTTYIPVPPDRLHADRATVGSPYRPEIVPDGSVPDGVLLVSGNAGIGTSSPRSDPPNGIATGNLDVNDAFLRGSNLWASQLAGARTVSGENASVVNVSSSGVLLVRLTVATSGRPLVMMGQANGNFSGNGCWLRMYRDGVLMDEVLWNTPTPGGPLPNSGAVMKTETALAAGDHVFMLWIWAPSGTVAPGGAKLAVMEI